MSEARVMCEVRVCVRGASVCYVFAFVRLAVGMFVFVGTGYNTLSTQESTKYAQTVLEEAWQS